MTRASIAPSPESLSGPDRRVRADSGSCCGGSERPRIGCRRQAGRSTPVARRPRDARRATLSALPVRLRTFAICSRGAAAIELAIGAVVLLGIVALCFDLYSRIEADTASARMAVAMADYVSREGAPDGARITALGQFLYDHELGLPADVVYVVSAVHQPAGDPPPAAEVRWVDRVACRAEPPGGEVTCAAAGAAPVPECGLFGTEGGSATLPSFSVPPHGFAMEADEVVVVAEVCVRLRREGSITGRFIAGDVYRLHALPARDRELPPAKPVRTAAATGNPGRTASAAPASPIAGVSAAAGVGSASRAARVGLGAVDRPGPPSARGAST